MSEFSVENNGASVNLVYKISDKDKLDNVTLGMFENNSIKGFLPMKYTQVNTEKLLKYNITSRVTMEQLFENGITKMKLVKTFLSIINGILESEEYMLDINTFLIDVKNIYVNVSTFETEILCLPVLNNKKVDLEAFFKNIIFTARFDQTENCGYVAEIISYLNSGSFSLGNFKKVLEEILFGKSSETTPANTYNVNNDNAGINTVANEQQNNMNPFQPNFAPVGVQQPGVAQNSVPQNTMAVPNSNIPGGAVPFPENNEKPEKKSKLGGLFGSGKKKEPKAQKEKKAAAGMNIPDMYIPGQGAAAPTAINGGVDNSQNNTSAPQAQMNQTQNPFAPTPQAQVNQAQNPFAPAPQAQMNQAQNSFAPAPQAMTNSNGGSNVQMSQGNYNQVGANFGETTVLVSNNNEIGETTVLGVGSGNGNVNQQIIKQPYLIRKKNNEMVLIDKSVFKIGKENSYVDYFIGDNTAISRSHASIVVKGDNYYIVDTNSKNHTYVNGNIIQPNIEVPINSGDKISLADDDFEFVMK